MADKLSLASGEGFFYLLLLMKSNLGARLTWLVLLIADITHDNGDEFFYWVDLLPPLGSLPERPALRH